jgi:hypothetical protein
MESVSVSESETNFLITEYSTFDSIEECNKACREHNYYKLIVRFNKEYVASLIKNNIKTLDEIIAINGDPNITELDQLVFTSHPHINYLERQFRSIHLEKQEYDDLLNHKRFLICANVTGSGMSNWEIFRMPNGVLYFVIRTPNYINHTFTYKYSIQLCLNIDSYKILF